MASQTDSTPSGCLGPWSLLPTLILLLIYLPIKNKFQRGWLPAPVVPASTGSWQPRSLLLEADIFMNGQATVCKGSQGSSSPRQSEDQVRPVQIFLVPSLIAEQQKRGVLGRFDYISLKQGALSDLFCSRSSKLLQVQAALQCVVLTHNLGLSLGRGTELPQAIGTKGRLEQHSLGGQACAQDALFMLPQHRPCQKVGAAFSSIWISR